MQNNSYHVQQISGRYPDSSYMLSLIVKRTYRIEENGNCILSDDQLPIVNDITVYEDAPQLMSNDTDLYPFKYFTDIIIKGAACSVRRSSRFLAGVETGQNNISFLILGKRKAYKTSGGEIKFTEPELIDEVPLRYDYAYGGKDIIAEQKIKLPDPALTKYLPKDTDLLHASLFRYQRNPMGKGYLVELNNDSIELLELPNIEDPEDVLNPQNIQVKDPKQWHQMPLPRCTDWMDPLWFPRIVYMGLENLQEKVKLTEIERQWADPDILSIKPMSGQFNLRSTNGASLGLQEPYIKYNETIKLTNMHRRFTDFVIHLPSEYPGIWVDGRKGKLLETKPVIHTVIIEPNENRISIVWRGSAPALRPYHDEELKTMPYKVEWNKR